MGFPRTQAALPPFNTVPAISGSDFGAPPSGRMHRRRLRWTVLAIAILAVTACRDAAGPLAPGHAARPGGGAVQGLASPPSQCGRLLPDEGLTRGQAVRSCDGRATLVLQTDHNVVLYDSAGASWVAPNTVNRGTSDLVMQGDGNLVAYDSVQRPLWASGTGGNPRAWLAVQDDCNMVVYRGPYPEYGGVLWTSNTLCRVPPPASGRMLPGEELSYGLSFTSLNGVARLTLRTDHAVELSGAAGPLWTAPNTRDRGTRALIMQHDGNFVAYDGGGRALWSSGTAGNAGAWLALQDDCNLVIYRGPYPQGNGVLWATGTPCARHVGNDYPASWIIGPPCGSGGDAYGFVRSNCTSFVAWRLDRDGKRIANQHGQSYTCSDGRTLSSWSHARCWDESARRLGLRVDKSPVVGAIAQWNSGTYGHVAYVAAVYPATGEVLIEEYNWGSACRYGTRRIPITTVENFIHF
jgi:surface antigen